MGLLAHQGVVVAATGTTRGQGPAAVTPVTTGLAGLDPHTGHRRWTLHLKDDGQGVPALLADGVVVVTEADGAVVGVDGATGTVRWHDPPPRACTATTHQMAVAVAVAPLPGAATATVVYQCLGQQQELVRLDPQTGTRRWAWQLPAGLTVVTPAVAATSAGTIGVLVSGRGAAAPVRPGWPTPHTGVLTLIAVDAATGRPRWQVDKVPASAGVYGAAGRLCVVAGFDVACYTAGDGARAWQRRPSVSSHGGAPEPTAVADHGQLLMVVPELATSSSRTAGTTNRPVAGAFRLQVMSLADGRVVAVHPLRSADLGPSQAPVSTENPPVVLAVTADTVLVGEGDIVEAFSR